MVKTTYEWDLPWSALFSVIVYWSCRTAVEDDSRGQLNYSHVKFNWNWIKSNLLLSWQIKYKVVTQTVQNVEAPDIPDGEGAFTYCSILGMCGQNGWFENPMDGCNLLPKNLQMSHIVAYQSSGWIITSVILFGKGWLSYSMGSIGLFQKISTHPPWTTLEIL